MAKKESGKRRKSSGTESGKLQMYTGAECVHCKESYPLIEKLEKELKVKVEKIEVWHDAENAAHLDSIDRNPDGSVFCGGVPFFFNEKTSRKLCGSQDYATLKAWASGK